MDKVNSHLKTILAQDIMTDDVLVISEHMTIDQVAHILLRNRVSGYPIVDDQKQVTGIITLTDLFILLDRFVNESHETGGGPVEVGLQRKIAGCKHMKVHEIMSKNVISITPRTPLEEVIEAVVKWRIHTFPVMEEGKLVGIIGRHDVLNAAFSYA